MKESLSPHPVESGLRESITYLSVVVFLAVLAKRKVTGEINNSDVAILASSVLWNLMLKDLLPWFGPLKEEIEKEVEEMTGREERN